MDMIQAAGTPNAHANACPSSGGGMRMVRRPRGFAAYDEFEGMGFSLKKIAGNIKNTVVKAAKDTAKQTVRSTRDVGHAAGAVVTSTPGKLVLGGVLAATGVGLPAAAGIMAASQAGGQLIKKGGNLKKAAKGGVEGAVEGTAAWGVGKVARNINDRRLAGKAREASAKMGTPEAMKPTAVMKVPQNRGRIRPDGLPEVGVTASGAESVLSDNAQQRAARAAAHETAAAAAKAAEARAAANEQRALEAERRAADAEKAAKTVEEKRKASAEKARARKEKEDAARDKEKHKSSVLGKLKDAAVERAKQGAENAAGAILTGSAGGFPVTPATISPADQNAESQLPSNAQASAGGIGSMLSNPIALVALVGIAFLVLNKRR